MSEVNKALLRRLAIAESSGDPNAINKQSGAQGMYQFLPSTTKMLHRMGHKFDPFNPKEAEGAAEFYLNHLVKQTGSLEGAVKAYGGFIKADPTDYLRKVLGDDYKGKRSDMAATMSSFEDRGLRNVDKGAEPLTASPGTGSATPTRSFEERGLKAVDTKFEPSDDAATRQSRLDATPQVVTQADREANERKRLESANTPFINKAIGAGEAGMATASGIGATIGALPSMLAGAIPSPYQDQFKGAAADTLRAYTYQPRTDKGEEYTKNLLDAVNRYAIPYVGSAPIALPAAANVARYVKGKYSGALDNVALKNANFGAQGGSVGAAGVKIESRVDDAIAGASDETRAKIAGEPIRRINFKAVENQNLADKFYYTDPVTGQRVKYQMTEGAVNGNVKLRSEEYNMLSAEGEDNALFQRLYPQRKEALENRLLDLRDEMTPSIYGLNGPQRGNALIDEAKAVAKPLVDAYKASYKALDDLPIAFKTVKYDNMKFAKEMSDALKKKRLTAFLPGQDKALLRKFTEKGVTDLDEYEALRSILGETARTGNGSAKAAAAEVRGLLDKLGDTFEYEHGQAKTIADTARKQFRDYKKLEESVPLVKIAMEDARTADQIAQGVLHEGADKVIQSIMTGAGPNAGTGNFQKTVAFLNSTGSDKGSEVLRAALLDHVEAAGFGKASAKEIFGTSRYIESLNDPKMRDKINALLNPAQLKELMDIGVFARKTDPVPATGWGNVSNTFRANKEAALDLAAGAGEIYSNIPGEEGEDKVPPLLIGGSRFVQRRYINPYLAKRRFEKALNPTFASGGGLNKGVKQQE